MYKIGVDLGGTNIAVGLVDENNSIVTKSSRPTNPKRTAEEIANDIVELCFEVCAAADTEMSQVENIGVLSPGVANCDSGEVEYSSNLPFRRFNLAGYVKEKTGVPRTILANDANAAAWGEAVAGAAKGTSSSIMITLGTGVGGGIILDGKILTGCNFAGAELGHMVIEKNGVPCPCGRRGCWESYSSATALIRMTREKIEEYRKAGKETVMSAEEKITGRTACDAMRAGDAAGREVYEKYLSYLATGLANIINIFQPEVISLGGGVSGEGQSLIDDLLPLVRAEQYGKTLDKKTELRIAQLGNDAGIIGAATL